MPSEFDLIQQYFDWQSNEESISLGVGDDAAIVSVPEGYELVVSVDTLCIGVHFPEDTPPDAIGYKSLAVNLSDMAAMGAIPKWFTLALTLPKADTHWVDEFSSGLKRLADKYDVHLIGGDTTRGNLTISIQIMGVVEKDKSLQRGCAQPGDGIYISGCLGDAATGLAVIQNRLKLADVHDMYCMNALNYPEPQLAISQIIKSYANACIDVSDGMLADLGHILKASNVGAILESSLIPLSDTLEGFGREAVLPFALSGGDDYQLVFTVPKSLEEKCEQEVLKNGFRITRVGEITSDKNMVIDGNCDVAYSGYDHFSV